MNEVWAIILNTVLIVVDCGIFYLYASLFLMPKQTVIVRKVLYSLAVIGILLLCLITIPDGFIKNIGVYLFAFILMARLFFTGKIQHYFITFGLYYFQMIVVDTLCATILNLIASPDNTMLTLTKENDLFSYALILLMKSISSYLYLILRWQKNKKIEKDTNRFQVGVLAVPVAFTAFIGIMCFQYWPMQNDDINTILLTFSMFQLIQTVYLLLYFTNWQKGVKRYYELKESYDSQRNFFNMLTRIQKAIQKMGHDIRHHFVYIMAALEKEDIPKAKQYLTQLDRNLENLVPVAITGNNDVDAIVNGKVKSAARQNVDLIVEGSLPLQLSISPVDLSILLGNALDNAIEAVIRSGGDTEKKVKLQVCYNNHRFSMIVENHFKGTLAHRPNGLFFTQKAHGGLGLEIISEVVNKYSGVFDIESNHDIFRVIININEPQETNRTITANSTVGKDTESNKVSSAV